MSLFDSWHRRHLAADPMEPASPPPFKMGDRVVVSPIAVDAMFIGGSHGEVIGVEFITDPEDVYGPWATTVLLDGSNLKMLFSAAELTREPDAPEPSTAEDIDEPVLYVPTGEVPADGVQHWIQRAKELRHETPVYDDVAASAMARDGLAAEVEAYLAEVAAGGAA